MNEFIEKLLSFIFPPKCQVCGGLGDKVICQECHTKIKFIDKTEGDSFFCAHYDGVMRKAIKRFKFNGKTSLSGMLGEMMARVLPFTKYDCIIPIPLHKRRFKERGFNQSELLAVKISDKHNVPVYTDVLIRCRDTKHQFDLRRGERFNNIIDAFAVEKSEKIKGRTVLIVDDIYTTGATIGEATRVLYSAGAQKVLSACLSRADSCMI